RTGRRLIPRRACKVAAAAEPFHRCGICGLTELKDPAADFRVCSRCGKEFCMSHLKEHPHDVV
ncbi:MAG: hypothetical protein WCG06_05480, partial [Candidatus Omnitrophota bacterium]